MDKRKKAIVASYARSVLGAGLALYMAGVTDIADLWAALVAAFAPVVLRALNPHDPAFGRIPTPAEIDEVTTTIKKPVKKAAPKKKTEAK
jgi:hypothetical protein